LRKVTVLINRAARNGCDRRRLDAIRSAFADCHLNVLTPDSYQALCLAAKAATTDGTDLVLVVGGDGTVNAVVNQLAHSATPLAIIPAGTANDLASHLDIPLNPRGACAVARRGLVQTIDLVRVNDRLFATAGGLGVLSDVAVGVNRLKARQGAIRKTVKILGSPVYVLYSFILLLFSRRIVSDLAVSADGQDLGPMRTIALFVNNQPSIGKIVVSYPGAHMADGKLGLCVMRQRNRLQSIVTVTLMSLKGRHSRRKDVMMREGRAFTITASEDKVFIGDGEVLATSKRMELSVVPGALRVISGRLLVDDAYLEVRVEKSAIPLEKLGADR